MFGQSRWVTALIVAGVIVVLVIFGLLIHSVVSTRSQANDFLSYATSSQTTVYVDPKQCPLCQAEGNTGVLNANGTVNTSNNPDQTPNVSGQAASTPPVTPGGGFFGGLFSSVPKDLPTGYTAKDLSPQFRRVRISSVKTYTGTAAATNADTIVLTDNLGSNDGAINVTGWKLQANQGSYSIQRAAKTYHTAGSTLDNVTLAAGQSVNVYDTTSAVNANFMGNSCMGYLNTEFGFVPHLAGLCSVPTKNEIATFTGQCQDYIMGLKSCQAGDPNDSRIPASDSACRHFVAGLNYDGCVKTHQADAKFYTNVWNLWSGKDFLDPLHDRVLLLDGNGKLVDYYLY